MSAAYAPVNERGGRGIAGGLRLRIRPFQALLLGVVVLVIVLPWIAGSERRAAISTWALGGNTLQRTQIANHIAPASGGINDAEGIPLTLEARLKHLLSRPALEQWEAELSNRYACPMFTYSRNTYFFHGDKDEKWHGVSKDDVKRYRAKMVEYLQQLDRDGRPLIWEPHMEDGTPKDQRRGIIYTGSGEGKDYQRMKFSLRMLTQVIKTKLPIEVYYYEGEMKDDKVRKELTDEFGVTLVQSTAKRSPGKTWEIKNRAFLDTKFTQFVYLDSDNIPLADPEDLFESVEFKQSGSVFWADLNKDHPDNAIWRILGRTCSDEHWPAESGQVVFDKSANAGLNLAVLHLSNHMMTEWSMYDFLSYGDKDTYRYSFYALGLPYQQASRLFASVGGYQRQDATSSPDYFCGHSMIQWGLTPPEHANDPTYHPKPAFLHNILTKHRYGLQPDKLWSHAKRPVEDFIIDPRLVRTLYEFTGDCFAITLKGPSGLPGTPNGFGDGQDTVIRPMSEMLSRNPGVWDALNGMAKDFAGINIPGT